MSTTEEQPKQWLYGLTADEWFTLACIGEESEVGPCCGNISTLRENLQTLATCQEPDGFLAELFSGAVMGSYDMALESHETLADPTIFPLLHRVLNGIKTKQGSKHDNQATS